jgi:hypothetical protein
MDCYTRKDCRLCGSSNLDLVLSLGSSPLCDAYVLQPKSQEYFPLDVNLCEDCTFVQIDTVVNPEVIYRDYLYKTTSSFGLDTHFSNYSDEVCEYLSYTDNKLVVDIGSNDGTLLSYFQNHNHRVIGVEPAVEIANAATNNGIETYPNFFDPDTARLIVSKQDEADLVTVNNLFANIDDLHEFMNAVDILLDSNGVFVVESSYLYKMIQNMVFDFIYHEHLSYLAARPLQTFMKKIGMHLINVDECHTKGGSLRYYFARMDSDWSVNDTVKDVLDAESSVDALRQSFDNFAVEIKQQRDKLRNFLDSFEDQKVVGYGASATSTTLISYFGLYDYLHYLVDDNIAKINTYSPGYNIPVYSADKLFTESADIIIVLAWRFRDEILKKISGLSCRVVTPLPSFHETLIGRKG